MLDFRQVVTGRLDRVVKGSSSTKLVIVYKW